MVGWEVKYAASDNTFGSVLFWLQNGRWVSTGHTWAPWGSRGAQMMLLREQRESGRCRDVCISAKCAARRAMAGRCWPMLMIDRRAEAQADAHRRFLSRSFLLGRYGIRVSFLHAFNHLLLFSFVKNKATRLEKATCQRWFSHLSSFDFLSAPIQFSW